MFAAHVFNKNFPRRKAGIFLISFYRYGVELVISVGKELFFKRELYRSVSLKQTEEQSVLTGRNPLKIKFHSAECRMTGKPTLIIYRVVENRGALTLRVFKDYLCGIGVVSSCKAFVFNVQRQNGTGSRDHRRQGKAVDKIPISKAVCKIVVHILSVFVPSGYCPVEARIGGVGVAKCFNVSVSAAETLGHSRTTVMLKFKINGCVLLEQIEKIGRAKGIVAHCVGVKFYVYRVIANSHIKTAAIVGKLYPAIARVAQKIVVYNNSCVSEVTRMEINMPLQHLIGEHLFRAAVGVTLTPCAKGSDVHRFGEILAVEPAGTFRHEDIQIFLEDGISVIGLEKFYGLSVLFSLDCRVFCTLIKDPFGSREERPALISAETEHEFVACGTVFFDYLVYVAPIKHAFLRLNVTPVDPQVQKWHSRHVCQILGAVYVLAVPTADHSVVNKMQIPALVRVCENCFVVCVTSQIAIEIFCAATYVFYVCHFIILPDFVRLPHYRPTMFFCQGEKAVSSCQKDFLVLYFRQISDDRSEKGASMKRKMYYLFLFVALVLVGTAILCSCQKDEADGKASSDKAGTTEAAETESLAPETEEKEPVTSRPNGSFEMGVNVNGLEDPNNTWKLMTAPGVLKNEKTYINIKEQGFDHIRIPVPFHSYFDAETEELDEKKMETVDKAIDLAIGQGLGVLLDFHGWYDFDPESDEHRKLFTAIWAVVADRYKEKSELLMFELINEPHYHKNTATLINFELDVVEVIRRTNPVRLVLIAGPDSNGPWKLSEVNIPGGYENLAMAVHIYEPGDFTHQGCTWAGREAGKQVRLTTEYLDSLKWNINEVKKFAQRTGIKVMITEVGMNVALAHEEDTDRYVRTLSQYCHDSGTSLAWWSYDGGDFGLYIKGAWRGKVLDAIFLK